jgi:hypothetical protein
MRNAVDTSANVLLAVSGAFKQPGKLPPSELGPVLGRQMLFETRRR